MKLKQFASLLTALLLLAAMAVPAFAEPDEIETATDPFAETQDSGLTAAPGFSIEPRMPGDEDGEDAAQEATFIAIMPYQATEPQTTIGIVPISGDLLPEAAPRDDLFSQRNMTLAALGMSGLAVLLSIIALARTRKKTPPNATGNYQKYF